MDRGGTPDSDASSVAADGFRHSAAREVTIRIEQRAQRLGAYDRAVEELRLGELQPAGDQIHGHAQDFTLGRRDDL